MTPGFWRLARRERGAYPRSVTGEQRRQPAKDQLRLQRVFRDGSSPGKMARRGEKTPKSAEKCGKKQIKTIRLGEGAKQKETMQPIRPILTNYDLSPRGPWTACPPQARRRRVDCPSFLHHFCIVSASLFATCFLQLSLHQSLPPLPLAPWCNSAPHQSTHKRRSLFAHFEYFTTTPLRPPLPQGHGCLCFPLSAFRFLLSAFCFLLSPFCFPLPPCQRQGQSNPVE
jgi:hypothetical protein